MASTTVGEDKPSRDDNHTIKSGTNVNKEIIQEALHDGPDEGGFVGAINWSRREAKKQKAFEFLRYLMKLDVVLSTLAIICLVYTIESEHMFGIRFYSISSLSWVFTSSTTKGTMLETQVYENIRPICWQTMYQNGYLEKIQYQSMVKRLVTEFDQYDETVKTRMIATEDLSELTNDWATVYNMTPENQSILPVNQGSIYNVDLVQFFRVAISVITILHCCLRIKYYVTKFELYSDHMLFLEKQCPCGDLPRTMLIFDKHESRQSEHML